MDIAILNIGGELLDGRTVNSNASHFANLLKANGMTVAEVRMIPDSEAAILGAMNDLSAYEEVIVSGGLGPTADDITAKIAAKFCGQKQAFLPAAETMIRRQLGLEQQKYTKTQRRQAYLPEKAKVIDNRWGIAPGFSVSSKTTTYSFLPGVPRECRPMLEYVVLPRLRKKLKKVVLLDSFVWRCFGAKEAEIYAKIAGTIEEAERELGENFSFSCLIPYPEIHIRIEFWQGKSKHVPNRKEREAISKTIDKKLGKLVFSREAKSLSQLVLEKLMDRRHTLSTAESCTGGMIGALLTETPGASNVYLGGVNSYSNASKQSLLNVRHSTLLKHGAVSEAVAAEMAQGAKDRLFSDYAISVTGIAGPDGGTREKPVGTVCFGIAGPRGTNTHKVWIKKGAGTREQNRKYAVTYALYQLLKTLD